MSIVLAFDPGKSNGAYCAIDSALRMRQIGMLKHPLQKFNDEAQVKGFKQEIHQLIDSIAPRYVVCERFQNRGRVSGEQVEFVSVMVGLILAERPDTELVPALTWKSALRKEYVTDQIAKMYLREKYARQRKKRKIRYKFEMEHLIETSSLTEHECDALGIALWKLEQLSGKQGLLWKVDDRRIK